MESYLTAAKSHAMRREAQQFYKQYPSQSWKNILSIGDSEAERLAQAERETSRAPAGKAAEEGAARSRLPKRLTVPLHKGQGDTVGVTLGSARTGAVIYRIQEGGAIDRWNKSNPGLVLRPGFIIEEVNGVNGYWNLLEVLRSAEMLVCRVSTEPPPTASAGWFDEAADIAKRIDNTPTKGPFMLRLRPEGPEQGQAERRPEFSSLPAVQAGDAGIDRCAICLQDVAPHESLVQLPCKHAFHDLCAARWLAQTSFYRSGDRRQSCPLCCRRMVGTPQGVVCCLEEGCCP